MRETLIQVFHNDTGFPQGQLAIHQRRYALARVEIDQILRRVILFHMLDLKTDTLLGQHDTNLMAINVSRTRKQRHYRTFVGSDSHENLQVYSEFYCYWPNEASQMKYRPSQRRHTVQESNKNRVFTDIWAENWMIVYQILMALW
ncbi:hypothetical protein ENTCAN_09255 [Enterobacter cancerogenus ATCC 35316]|nr:hypothetical protein ENTCAN_09255 [Enterobacter cancerogenus ATCC 35316]